MRNKLLFSGIIAGIIFCISYICFAGEKEELQLKEAYYQKAIQCAQYEIILSQNELKNVQDRLRILERNAQEEAKKSEIKTSNTRSIDDAIHYTPEEIANMEKLKQSKKEEKMFNELKESIIKETHKEEIKK